MIPAAILKEIQSELLRLEAEEGIKIRFAVESGSRAWGFPSQDSNYDVRFVSARQPWDYYARQPWDYYARQPWDYSVGHLAHYISDC